MKGAPLTPEEIREAMKTEDVWGYQQVARWVRERSCQCCPGDGDYRMDCGHFICELCKMRGHEHQCIACALAC